MKKTLYTVFVLAILVIGGLGIFLRTGLSLRAGLSLADRFIPGRITVRSMRGNLTDFTLDNLRYKDGSTSATIASLSLQIEPLALLKKTVSVRSLELKGLEFHLPEAVSEETNPGASSLPPAFSMPVALKVESASIERIQIFRPGNDPPVMISRILLSDLSARGDLFKFDNLEITVPSYHLKAAGKVQTNALYTADLSIDYALDPEGYSPIAGNAVVTGSSSSLKIQAILTKPFQGNLVGVLDDLVQKNQWQAELTADHASLTAINPGWPHFVFSGFKASGSGTLAGYTVKAAADTTYGTIEDVQVTTTVSGNKNGLRFTDTRLTRQQGNITGQGRLAWEDTFTWQASLDGTQINMTDINPTWPPLFIPAVTLFGGGTGGTYTLDVEGDLRHPAMQQEIHAASEISGNGAGLRLDDLTLNWLDGVVKGTGSLAWENFISWQADFSGRGVDPAILYPQLPGKIDFHVTSSGRQENEQITAGLNVVSLTGMLREYPLEGGGDISLDGTAVAIEELHLLYGNSKLSVQGRYGPDVAVDFKLKSENLGEFWPGLAGRIDAAGHLKGTPDLPTLEVKLSGEQFSYEKIKLDRFAGTFAGNLTMDGFLRADIQADGGSIGSQPLTKASAAFEGTPRRHQLQSDFSLGQDTIRLQLDGGVDDTGQWKGLLETASLNTARFGNWRLAKSTALVVGKHGGSVQDLCLTGASDARLCLAGDVASSAVWQAQGEIVSLPLSILQQWAEKYAAIEGSLSGSVSLAGKDAELMHGEVRLSTGDAFVDLVLPDRENRRIYWRKNDLKAVYDERQLNAEFMSVLEDGSSMQAEAKLMDFVPVPFVPGDITINGSLDFAIADLKPLSVVTYPTVDPSGQLNGQMNITGSLLKPQLRGFAQLQDGKLAVPPLGIIIEEVRMNLADTGQQLRFDFSALSGQGSLQGNGTLALDQEDKTLHLQVQGDRFELAGLPEIRLAVSPELTIVLDRNKGEFFGTVVVPEALIAPRTLSEALRPSRDVVLSEDQGDKDMKWPLSARLTVVLGENVRLNAFGLRGNLAGKLLVEDMPSKPVTGEGTLVVQNGTFSIYGRELRIETGRLLYSAGPIDNPGIDVRAENTAGGVTTGIMVTGFLQEPQISFYSNPPLEEDEIITRLLMNASLVGSSDEERGFVGSVTSETGLDPLFNTVRDIKQGLGVDDVKIETGKTSEDLSLVIGTWLTPSLYVSYGKNLLKESGSFHTRYTIGHGFFLETESGTTQSGGDLKYELEH